MRVSCLWSRLPASALILLVGITSILCAPPFPYPELQEFPETEVKLLATVAGLLPNGAAMIQELKEGRRWPIPYNEAMQTYWGRHSGKNSLQPFKLPKDPSDNVPTREELNKLYRDLGNPNRALEGQMGLEKVNLGGTKYLMGKEMATLVHALGLRGVRDEHIVSLFDTKLHSREERLAAVDQLARDEGFPGFVLPALERASRSRKNTQTQETERAHHGDAQGLDGQYFPTLDLGSATVQRSEPATGTRQPRTNAGRGADRTLPRARPYGGQATTMTTATHGNPLGYQPGTSYPSHVYQQPQFASGPSSRAGYGPFEPSEWQQSASTASHPHGGYAQFQPQLGVDYTTQNRYGPSATHPDPNHHPSYRFDTTPAHPHLSTAGQYPGSSSLGPDHRSGTPYPTHQWDHTSSTDRFSSSPLDSHHDESDPRTLNLISHFGEGTG